MPRSPSHRKSRAPEPNRRSISRPRTAAPHHWDSPQGLLDLKRFPPRNNATLQAWDGGDEWLLERLLQAAPAQHLLLVNDHWGALLCGALKQFSDHPASRITLTSDSYVSRCGYQQNTVANALPQNYTVVSPLDPLPDTVDRILLRLPKSQSLLERQLAQMSCQLSPGTPLLVSAKSQLFTPAVRELFEHYCDDVNVSLIQRKHRILEAKIKSQPWPEHQFLTRWQELDVHLTHHAGVFARNQLDLGARFLLEVMEHKLERPQSQQVIDLGCGNGILGIRYAQQHADARVTWLDESYLAAASCQLNVTENLGDSERYQVAVDDCLSRITTSSVDLILCNPPFHQEHAVTDHIAKQMIRDAKRVLKSGGELWLVANRHLPYYPVLQKAFRQVETVDQNSKFMVYRAS